MSTVIGHNKIIIMIIIIIELQIDIIQNVDQISQPLLTHHGGAIGGKNRLRPSSESILCMDSIISLLESAK